MGGSRPNSDFYFFQGNFVFFPDFLGFCFLCCFHVSQCFKKKSDRVVGGWGLTNPSFSRIFGFVLTGQDPLARKTIAMLST